MTKDILARSEIMFMDVFFFPGNCFETAASLSQYTYMYMELSYNDVIYICFFLWISISFTHIHYVVKIYLNYNIPLQAKRL